MLKKISYSVIGLLLLLPAAATAQTVDIQAQLAALLAQLAALQQQLAQAQTQQTAQTPVTTGSTIPCPNPALTRSLSRGSTGTDVAALQGFLINTGHLAAGNTTGYFGALTEAAVQRFQSAKGIAYSGTPDTTGYGYVGPKTRQVIMQVCSTPITQISVTPPPIQPSQNPAAFTNFNASPLRITAGQQSTLTWNVQNASGCVLSQQVPGMASVVVNVNLPVSGTAVVAPTQSIVYTIVCTATGVQNQGAIQSIGVTVDGVVPTASTTPTATASCTFTTQTILHGASVTAYQSSSVAAGSQCAQQTRTCNNGVLSGAYQYATCAPGTAAACLLDGATVSHGQTRTFYSASTVSYSESCDTVGQSRTCTNGTLSGSSAYNKAACSSGQSSSCSFNGQSVVSSASISAYQASSVAAGQQCAMQTRVCSNGTLSGSYQYSSCTVAAATASCTFNTQTILHGASVTAYQSSSVAAGSQCVQQTRTCSNGVLSGAYQYATCAPAAAQTCTLGGITMQSGESRQFYDKSNVPLGNTCSASVNRTCTNGALSGNASYKYAQCIVGETIDTLSYFVPASDKKQVRIGTDAYVWNIVTDEANKRQFVVKRHPTQLWNHGTWLGYYWDSSYIYFVENQEFEGSVKNSWVPGGIWFKRSARVGEAIDQAASGVRLVVRERVGCAVVSDAPWVARTVLEAHYPDYNLGGDLGVQDVIALRIEQGDVSEKEFYAKGWGLVQWQLCQTDGTGCTATATFNDITSEVPPQPDNTQACRPPLQGSLGGPAQATCTIAASANVRAGVSSNFSYTTTGGATTASAYAPFPTAVSNYASFQPGSSGSIPITFSSPGTYTVRMDVNNNATTGNFGYSTCTTNVTVAL